jgi:predicted dehydrogenase
VTATLPVAAAGPTALQARLPRLGFLGVGWIGRHRLASLATSGTASVSLIADPCRQAAETAARLAPGARVADRLEDVLDADLDGLVIATPSALHADQAIAAMQRGLAVFCQKPLARTGDEARRVVASARAADRLLHVDFSYRHLAASNALRRLVRSGELGHIYAVEAVFHNAYGPSSAWARDRRLSGGGCLIDLGVHLVDLALWLLDARAVATATGRRYAAGRRLAAGDPEVEDFATAMLTLETGATVSLACSWNAAVGRDCVIRLALHGTAGGAVLENVDGSFYDFRAEHHRDTRSEVLCAPPDVWGGRAAVAWAYRLATDRRFDPAADRFVAVADVLDRVYAS